MTSEVSHTKLGALGELVKIFAIVLLHLQPASQAAGVIGHRSGRLARMLTARALRIFDSRFWDPTMHHSVGRTIKATE
jgi:hypothetical protein